MEEKACPCPHCSTPGLVIETLSRLFHDIDYYECRTCAHVWTVPKNECEPAAPVAL